MCRKVDSRCYREISAKDVTRIPSFSTFVDFSGLSKRVNERASRIHEIKEKSHILESPVVVSICINIQRRNLGAQRKRVNSTTWTPGRTCRDKLLHFISRGLL